MLRLFPCSQNAWLCPWEYPPGVFTDMGFGFIFQADRQGGEGLLCLSLFPSLLGPR